MKTFLTLFLSLVLSLSAFAGNEGPQATPSTHGKLIAESIVSIAFAPESVPSSIRYQIYSSGYTQMVTNMRDNSVFVKVLKHLSAEEVALINSLVEEVVPGALFDPNPSSPGCYDAPYERKVVYASKGEIKISEWFACKDSERENANHADAELIKILKSLSITDDL